MKKSAFSLTCVFAFMATAWSEEEAPEIVYKPLSIGALEEFGQLGHGVYKIGSGNIGEVWTNDWIDHFGAFLTKEAVVDGRLFLTGGLGGITQFRKPELVDPGFYGSQRRSFFIGPTKAMADYHFGDPEKPWLTLGSGMFMFKYNPDANNLGEYLFRSGAYPQYTITGGYTLINSAMANLQGVKSSLDMGHFKADLLMTTETGFAPLYDWSVGGVASYSFADGVLELGAGVNFKRLISVRPSRTSPPSLANGYFTLHGQEYTSNLDYYQNQISYYNRRNKPSDSARAAAIQAMADTVMAATDPARTTDIPTIKHYTNAGTLLMARAALDLKKLFSSDAFGPQDLRLYSEAAVLGIKDYPVFYSKITERIPVMVGFNLPGFRYFDLISVQAEIFKSHWLNNTSQIANDQMPLPFFPIAQDSVIASTGTWNNLATKDDVKWSVLVQKKLGQYITFSAQAANDHMRLVSSRYFYGPQYDHNEITISSKDWYWMTQLSWGI